MIKSLQLENFRAFKSAEIEFRKITIIAGQNSSGKSSILQAINSVLQSTQGRTFPFDLVLNGSKAHLGGFKNVVHGHNARNSFGVGIEFTLDGKTHSFFSRYKKPEEENHLFPTQIKLRSDSFGTALIEWNRRTKSFFVALQPSETLVNEKKINLENTFGILSRSENHADVDSFLDILNITDKSQVSSAISTLFDAVTRESANGDRYQTSDFSQLISKAASNPFFESITKSTSEAIKKLESICTYLGPLRATPSRYIPLGGSNFGTDGTGEGTSRTLGKWKERSSSLISEVKNSLSELELASDLTVTIEHDEFLKVGIKPHGRSYIDSIADVGFGLSQILPMIVGDINLPPDGTLIVNQPEIHLHPSSQAKLANYFSKRAHEKQYIIETHSEYLINRLRLLVARGDLDCDMISLIYCSADEKGGSTIHNIGIERNGSLSNAPADFFSTYSADAFGIAMAVVDDDSEDDTIEIGNTTRSKEIDLAPE